MALSAFVGFENDIAVKEFFIVTAAGEVLEERERSTSVWFEFGGKRKGKEGKVADWLNSLFQNRYSFSKEGIPVTFLINTDQSSIFFIFGGWVR